MSLKNYWVNKKIGWTATRILLACIGIGALIMLFEEKFIYFPAKYPQGVWEVDKFQIADGRIIPKIEDCRFVTVDGVNLHGWYCTPQRVANSGTTRVPAEMVLLWFHGNAGNITHRYDMIEMLMDLPVNVFIIDYRGYGKSEGNPSEQGLYYDSQAAWDYLTKKRGIRPDRIVIFGKSIGTVPAIDLATKVNPAGLIVQSGFTSLSDMVAATMPFIPRFLVRSRMTSIDKIHLVHCPKLFIHSPADEIIPYELGRRLFDAALEPKQFYEVAGSPHNETYLVGGKKYFNALRSFVQSCGVNGLAG